MSLNLNSTFYLHIHLASTIFHESYHAFQYVWNGGSEIKRIEAGFGKIYYDELTQMESRGLRELERKAYNFEKYMGNNDSQINAEIRSRTD